MKIGLAAFVGRCTAAVDWSVVKEQNAVSNSHPDTRGSPSHTIAEVDNASACAAAAAENRSWLVWTWHDSKQGQWANKCVVRDDSSWKLTSESGHTSGCATEKVPGCRPTPPPGTCVTDDDCHLNGLCHGGACACVAEWTGETCGVLNLHPARPSPNSGYDEAGTSSWGGGIIADESGLYHMFVSRMVDGGGLNTWTEKSEIVHATSADPEGPYTMNETILVPFAHGPSVRSLGEGKDYMMMHLGCGRAMDAPDEVPCTQFNVSVMTAPSLFGPWSDSKQVFLNSGATDPSWYVPSGRQFSNPAPLVLPNGSVICAYRADARSGGEHVSIAKASSPFGPYVDEHAHPIDTQWSEDPFIWQDERRHWHILLHGPPEGGSGVGGHAFSRSVDGPWTLSSIGPYTSTVQFADGTSKKMNRRERPQLFLSDSGQPRYFSSGVEDVGQHTYTLVMRVVTGDDDDDAVVV